MGLHVFVMFSSSRGFMFRGPSYDMQVLNKDYIGLHGVVLGL